MPVPQTFKANYRGNEYVYELSENPGYTSPQVKFLTIGDGKLTISLVANKSTGLSGPARASVLLQDLVDPSLGSSSSNSVTRYVVENINPERFGKALMALATDREDPRGANVYSILDHNTAQELIAAEHKRIENKAATTELPDPTARVNEIVRKLYPDSEVARKALAKLVSYAPEEDILNALPTLEEPLKSGTRAEQIRVQRQ